VDDGDRDNVWSVREKEWWIMVTGLMKEMTNRCARSAESDKSL